MAEREKGKRILRFGGRSGLFVEAVWVSEVVAELIKDRPADDVRRRAEALIVEIEGARRHEEHTF
jgi:hypothetical protein